MKILTCVGTRPEIIRLSKIIKLLDKYTDHIVVHTGQNSDYCMNEIFFNELELRKPDYFLNAKGTFAEQLGIILPEIEKIIIKEKPDKFLILGDTNSALSSIVAKRRHIPVYHLEAGNRSYNIDSPEEVNRKIIDHSSDILMPYVENSKHNLLRENIHPGKIFVVGNPIYEIIEDYKKKEKDVFYAHSVVYLKQYIYRYVSLDNIEEVESNIEIDFNKMSYILITLHREENVNNFEKFEMVLESLRQFQNEKNIQILFSLHPRSRRELLLRHRFFFKNSCKIIFFEPVGFYNFLKLESNAKCIITDSGTVQEECHILHKPCVIIRDITERPETIESGSVIVSKCDTKEIRDNIECVLKNANDVKNCCYTKYNVSETVLNILLGNYYDRI